MTTIRPRQYHHCCWWRYTLKSKSISSQRLLFLSSGYWGYLYIHISRKLEVILPPHSSGIAVPQGSRNGPALIIIMVNDIQALELYGEIQLFADDIAIKYKARSLEQRNTTIWDMVFQLSIKSNWTRTFAPIWPKLKLWNWLWTVRLNDQLSPIIITLIFVRENWW